MSRKQILVVKEEPEDAFDFNELFPVVNECPFSPLTTNGSNKLEHLEPKSNKSDVPALWFIEKCRIEEDNPDGVSKSRNLSELGTTKDEVLNKLLPPKKQLSPDVIQRAAELKEQERIHHEDFVATMLSQYPVDKSYHPNKARKYATSDYDADEDSKRQTEARKNNNGKSMESRHKKKVERAVNAYTIIHLRERILAYQTRMSLMKEMLLQENVDMSTIDDDQRAGEEISMFDESDIESLSSISSF